MKYAVLDITSNKDIRFLNVVEGAIPKIACMGVLHWLETEREVSNTNNKFEWYYDDKRPTLKINNGQHIFKVVPLDLVIPPDD